MSPEPSFPGDLPEGPSSLWDAQCRRWLRWLRHEDEERDLWEWSCEVEGVHEVIHRAVLEAVDGPGPMFIEVGPGHVIEFRPGEL